MKFATVLTGVCALASSASAMLSITLPDADTQWFSGSTGVISWNSSATEFGLLCDIQLVDVETTEAVYNITNTSIPCSINNYTTGVLPAFENQLFMVRIGLNNNASVWSYTQDFEVFPQGCDGNVKQA